MEVVFLAVVVKGLTVLGCCGKDGVACRQDKAR